MASPPAPLTVAAAFALASFGASCRPVRPPAVDPELAACISPQTAALAGLHLDRLRASQTFRQLAAGSPLLEPLRTARDLLLAYNGKDFLVAARGAFSSAAPGVILLSPSLALAGSPAAIRAATAQHAAGRPGAPALLERASAVSENPIWAVIQGGAALPLAGNAANLNRLLRLTGYATLAADVNSQFDADLTAYCATPEAARQIEENLRALASLAAAGTRDPGVSSLWHSVQVRRDNLVVHTTLSAAPQALAGLLRGFQR